MKWTGLLLSLVVFLGSTGCGIVGSTAYVPESEREITEPNCFDTWSVVHISAGGIMGELLTSDSLGLTLLGLIGYEVIEPYFWFDFGENDLNQACDVAAGVVGWAITTADDD